MTKRLERTIVRIEDDFMRSFLSAADNKDSPAGQSTMATLETLAEKWADMEKRIKEAENA